MIDKPRVEWIIKAIDRHYAQNSGKPLLLWKCEWENIRPILIAKQQADEIERLRTENQQLHNWLETATTAWDMHPNDAPEMKWWREWQESDGAKGREAAGQEGGQ